MTRTLNRRGAVALSAAIASLVAGGALAQSGEPIKVGVLLPFTGTGAYIAQGNLTAQRMAVKEINEAGGLLGRPVEIVQADDQFDPTQAVNEARRLTQQAKVSFVMGPVASNLANAVAPIMTETKTLWFATAVAPVTGALGFSGMMSSSEQAVAMVNFAIEHLKAKSVAIIHDNGGASKALVEEFKTLIPARGLELKGLQEHAMRDADTTAQLLSLRRLNPDVLLHTSSTGEDAGQVIKNMADIGWTIRTVSTTTAQATGGTLKVAGPDALKGGNFYGIVFKGLTYCAADKPGEGGFGAYLARLRAFDAKAADNMDARQAIYLYDAMILAKSAIQATRSLDGTVLASWIENNAGGVKGVSGIPFGVKGSNHFMMGRDALTFVNRPDQPRAEDKLTLRTIDC
jgi:branched-chain amino acid transport system substrate-binding protein